MPELAEVDALEIKVLVNDQIDNIAHSRHPDVDAPGRLTHMPWHPIDDLEGLGRGSGAKELRFTDSCCGAHGLSLMITATKGNAKHTFLMDAGPGGEIWKQNVKQMRLEQAIADIEVIQLSHWHRDHSGGLEEAIRMISRAKSAKQDKVVVTLYPDRPMFRGAMTPKGPLSIEADPTFAELTAAGGIVSLHSQDYTILDDTFFISGQIPRTTAYETGFTNGIRIDSPKEGWKKDELILDERFVMCNLKGKGLVVISGCGHAGVVNTARRAVHVGNKAPLFAIIGGFHLTDADKEKVQNTVADLMKLEPKVLMPGHCSGWRFTAEAERVMPDRLVPLYGGQVYRL